MGWSLVQLQKHFSPELAVWILLKTMDVYSNEKVFLSHTSESSYCLIGKSQRNLL